MRYTERIHCHQADLLDDSEAITSFDTKSWHIGQVRGSIPRLSLKSKFIGAAALILNARPALIGFAIILVLHVITAAHCRICNAITVLSSGNGSAFSPNVATASSIWKVAVLITLAIAVASALIPVWCVISPVIIPVTWAEVPDSRPPIWCSHALVWIRLAITAAYGIVVARAGGWRRDTLALLATVGVLFQAKLVSITVGAAVADVFIPIIARRTVAWACRAINKTTCRPPAIVARFIGGHICTVAWCCSHAVLAKRAMRVGTVIIIAALGPARGDRSSSFGEEWEQSKIIKLVIWKNEDEEWDEWTSCTYPDSSQIQLAILAH